MSRRRPPRDVIDPTTPAHPDRHRSAPPDLTDPLSHGAHSDRGGPDPLRPHADPPGIDPHHDGDGRVGPGAEPLGGDAGPDPAAVLARMRPATPRSWRERLDDLLVDVRRGPGLGAPATLAAGGLAAVVLAVVVVVAWQVVAASAAAPEADLPRASAPTDAPTAPPPAALGSDAAVTPGSTTASAPGSEAGAVASTAAPGAPTGVASGEVVVHVVGAVAAPGVQRLPAGARVTDAVEAAGGATADADLARVNLAATVTDGTQIVVPRPGEMIEPVVPVAPAGGAGTAPAAGSPDGGTPVNVNTAAAAELEELPGIGPVTAAAIVAHRDEFGPFSTVDQLIDVRGIGEAKLEQLRSRATV